MRAFPVVSHPRTTGSDPFALSPFVLEWFAAGKWPSNQLPISAVCNCRCLFCSNNLNPFPIISGAFRDVEDVKLQLCAMRDNNDPIYLSESLPGRISEGEALLHPRLFEILELVRMRFFCNPLCFTTNGSLLNETFIKRLAAFRPIEFTVSMHSTKPGLWAKIFAGKEEDGVTAVAALPLLKKYGMKLVGTIVPLPSICGWEDLERTYEHFISNGAKRMVLYWPGSTVRTPENIAGLLACPLEEFTAFAQRMKSRFSTPVDPLPDTATPLDVPVQTIIAQTLRGNPKTRGGAYRHVVWLASSAAVDRLKEMVGREAATVANRHDVVAADNLTYQGNIIVAGLLMTDDLVHAGRSALERWPDTDLFLVPARPFDSLHRDLKGTPAYTMTESLGRPVWLVRDKGLIDSQLSFRMLSPCKPFDSGLEKAMNALGAACTDGGNMEEGARRGGRFPGPHSIGRFGTGATEGLAPRRTRKNRGTRPRVSAL